MTLCELAETFDGIKFEIVYHVLNRAVGKLTLLEKDGDYVAFERILEETFERTEICVLSVTV